MHTDMEGFTIRPAVRDDAQTILDLIRGLAEYEKMQENFVADRETFEHFLFEQKAAEVLLAEYSGTPVGYALFFTSFSTFLGRPGIYLEDLYIKPGYRGQGMGKAVLSHLAALAVERGYGRLEWSCLDWNKPSIAFYRGLGAKPLSEWTMYRADGKVLEDLAGNRRK